MSWRKYTNVLKELSPILENKKHCLQTVFIRTLDPYLPLSKLKELIYDLKVNEIKLFVGENWKRLIAMKGRRWRHCKKEATLAARGCNFLLKNIRDEAYILQKQLPSELKFINQIHTFYPYILVSFDEEVMFLKVQSLEKYEVLGTSNFNMHSVLRLAKPLLKLHNVKDTVSLAKLFAATSPGAADETFDPLQTSLNEDEEIEEMSLAFGVVNMVCKNIGLMTSFYAKVHGVSKVIFGENVSDDLFLKKVLANSVKNIFSNNIQAIFLRHENFISGIGAMLSSTTETELNKLSWEENYCESSGMTFQFCFFEDIQCQQLSLDALPRQVICPLLLTPHLYSPHTQNLQKDLQAREYWIQCIKNGVGHGIERNISETTDLNAINGLQLYKDLVLNRMDYLKSNPQAYGELSMRILQDTMEHMKRETGLTTMYEKRKEIENGKALEELKERLMYIDSLDEREMQEELIISMLAGNMFDWGAKEVAILMRQGRFGFVEAMEKLPVRPWLIDHLDEWTERSLEAPFKCAMIFCDNSGYDVILGIVPFARDLLKKATKVILCVNKEPVLNDVTYYELKELLEKIKLICPIVKDAHEQQKLSILGISKSTCCLDLRFIDAEIGEKMMEVDLLVIEGMGRAIHTNLFATFTCESLRVAVVKDAWFSAQLGGHAFACVCKYTR